MPDNRGFAHAFNQAVCMTHDPFVLSLNPDVTLRSGFLAELVHAITQDERIGTAVPKLLRADAPERLDSTGLFIDRRRRPYDRGQGEIDQGQYDKKTEVFGGCGAAALYRRAMLDDLAIEGEYFDEEFFAYYEDVDLAWRAQSRRWRAVYVPTAVATHVRGWGDTLRKQREKNAAGPRLALRNRYLMTVKNDSFTSFITDVPLILATELPRLIFTAFSVPKALLGLWDIVHLLPSTWLKREHVQATRTIDTNVLRLNVWRNATAVHHEDDILYLDITTTTAVIKRFIDIVGALTGIVLTSPIMLLMIILIKIDLDGPALFIQERAGKNGKVFKIYKFRTMVMDSGDRLEQLIKLDELEEPVFKIKDDPRVTRLGHILRRTCMDELPQFFNVLKGEMSLVGPRPEEVRLVQRYNDWHRTRLLVKPGITGPAQIKGIGDLSLRARVELEEEYIYNYSLRKDFEILLKTIPAVIRGIGCY
jgi:lipopolysaccharide/colanic/teichoic acid biosynthesis glycosyltransferase